MFSIEYFSEFLYPLQKKLLIGDELLLPKAVIDSIPLPPGGDTFLERTWLPKIESLPAPLANPCLLVFFGSLLF